MESIVKFFSDSLKVKRSSSELVSSHSLNWSRITSLRESIVKLFLDSLNMKRLSSDLVFVTLIKMVLNKRLFGASLPLFRTD
jgi:hypothetical protein